MTMDDNTYQQINYIQMTTPFCSFCQINGFNGPHDHYVRASKEPTAKVTCPMLIATICGFCGKNGHTAKFCGEAKNDRHIAKTEALIASKKAFNDGEWITQDKRVVKQSTMCINPVNVMVSGFSILGLDTHNECECKETDGHTEAVGTSWADVAKGKVIKPQQMQHRPKGMSWADWDDDTE